MRTMDLGNAEESRRTGGGDVGKSLREEIIYIYIYIYRFGRVQWKGVRRF